MNTTPLTLAGRTALVTGSTSGLGAGLAVALGAAGAQVVVTGRSEEFADGIAPILARVPTHRMSTVAEVASAVVFLADSRAGNINGAILSVDGGLTAV